MGKEVAIASEWIYEGRLVELWVDAVYLSERMMSRRELQEERGYVAGSLERLCGFYPTPGCCEEYIWIYLARDLEASGRGGEAEGKAWVSLPQTLVMVDHGRSRMVKPSSVSSFVG